MEIYFPVKFGGRFSKKCGYAFLKIIRLARFDLTLVFES